MTADRQKTEARAMKVRCFVHISDERYPCFPPGSIRFLKTFNVKLQTPALEIEDEILENS